MTDISNHSMAIDFDDNKEVEGNEGTEIVGPETELNKENENCEDADMEKNPEYSDVLELDCNPGEHDEIDPKSPDAAVTNDINISPDPGNKEEAIETDKKDQEEALKRSRVLWITGDLERTMKANDFRVSFSPFGRVESGKLALIGPEKECVGIVTMQTVEGADAVLAGITEINGRSVKIEKKLRDPTDKKGNKSKSNEPKVKNIINLSTKRRLSADGRSPSSGTSDRVGTGTQAGPESKRGKVTDRLGAMPKLEPPNKELLNKLSDQLSGLRRADKRSRNDLRQKENDLTKLRKEQSQLNRDNDSLRKKISETKNSLDKLKKERKGLDLDKREDERKIKKLKAEIRDTKSDLDREKDKLKNTRAELRRFEQRIKGGGDKEREERERLQAERRKLEEDRRKYEIERERLQKEMSKSRASPPRSSQSAAQSYKARSPPRKHNSPQRFVQTTDNRRPQPRRNLSPNNQRRDRRRSPDDKFNDRNERNTMNVRDKRNGRNDRTNDRKTGWADGKGQVGSNWENGRNQNNKWASGDSQKRSDWSPKKRRSTETGNNRGWGGSSPNRNVSYSENSGHMVVSKGNQQDSWGNKKWGNTSNRSAQSWGNNQKYNQGGRS